MKKHRILSIDLTKEHQEKMLELVEYYLLQKDEKSLYPYFGDFGIIYTNKENSGIHWYELLSNVLVKEIFKTKHYWINRYVVQCIEIYFSTCTHPIDWVFDKHQKLINNIPLHRTAEEQMADMIKETKKVKKELKKEDKQISKLTNLKTKEDDFFN